jgi:non-ribosomal peptide synthetase component E (peptide arylation enzyme)
MKVHDYVYSQKQIKEFLDRGIWVKDGHCDKWDWCAGQFPDKEALVDYKTRMTWSEAKLYQDRVALGFLDLGLQKDEVIVIHLPMWAEVFVTNVACEKAGIIHCSAPSNLQEKDLEYVIQTTGAAGIIIPWKWRDRNYFDEVQAIRRKTPKLRYVFMVGDEVPEGVISINKMMREPIEKRYPEDYLQKTKMPAWEVSNLYLTTGTTGLPKITEHVSGARLSRYVEAADKFGMTKDDIVLVMGPGMVLFSLASDAAIIVGAKIVMQERFEQEEALKIIQNEKVTAFGTVPTMLQRMLAHPNFDKYDLGSVRFIRCGGSFVPPELCQEAERKFGAKVVQTYGSADRGAGTFPDINNPPQIRWATASKPDRWSKIKIVDNDGNEVPEGEIGTIMFFCPTGAVGYFNDPKGTKEAYASGWYPTGDLGKLDADQNLIISGRKRDIIIRGGQNISPEEVERVLQLHPKVFQVAIVKMPDPEYGERACAYVVTREGEKLTFEEMVAFLKKQKISSYKIPERLEVIERMPLAGEAKINKKALEKDIEEKLKKKEGI